MNKIEKNSAQEIADAIQSLLLLDVTIVDKTLKRIAAKHYGQGHKRQTEKRGLLTTSKG